MSELHLGMSELTCNRPASRWLLAAATTMLLLGFGPAATAAAQTWAERLGFPADKKVVILHAHDAGMCYESNAAVAELLATGPVRSASAMAPCPWFADFAQWRRLHADADVGLDLTLNSELENYRWQAVAADGTVSSLLDGDGYLARTVVQTMVNATAEEVERELEAQLQKARSAGLNPTHLSTHLGALYTRLELAEVYLGFARRHWIPAVVVELTPAHIERFRSQGYPLPEELVQLIGSYPLPKIDELRILTGAESYEQKKAEFIELIDGLPPGLTQIAFAPAVASDALRHVARDWQQRVWEVQLFADDEVRARLGRDDVQLTDWRELMARFEGRPPVENENKAAASQD